MTHLVLNVSNTLNSHEVVILIDAFVVCLNGVAYCHVCNYSSRLLNQMTCFWIRTDFSINSSKKKN